MATRFDRVHTKGVGEQLAMIRLAHPTFRASVRDGLLVCRGTIKPTDLNRRYRVRIEYRAKSPPTLVVEDPPLRRRQPDEKIPHTYEEDRPCVYLPSTGEWRSDKYIAHTIVPWLSTWLFFYEVWRATGEWLGGGIHPEVRQRLNRANL
jgi:hypothetical protein